MKAVSLQFEAVLFYFETAFILMHPLYKIN